MVLFLQEQTLFRRFIANIAIYAPALQMVNGSPSISISNIKLQLKWLQEHHEPGGVLDLEVLGVDGASYLKQNICSLSDFDQVTDQHHPSNNNNNRSDNNGTDPYYNCSVDIPLSINVSNILNLKPSDPVQLRLVLSFGDKNESSGYVTISRTGLISCQIFSSQVLCQIQLRVTFLRTDVSASLSDSQVFKANVISLYTFESFRNFLHSKFWTFFAVYFFMLLLIYLNNFGDSVTQITANVQFLQMKIGQPLHQGQYISGCMPNTLQKECQLAYLSLSGTFFFF